MSGPERGRTWPYALALAAQNVATYWSHYFGTAGIPWDFSLSYFGMVAFWTSLVRDGVFPQWVPFQQMGYPFALQMQSGMNYLPFWIFPLLGLRYTLRAAIIFQCVHVLAGAFGMFQLARHIQRSPREALVAAVAYQAFGGFFSNAEHPDIVRAFALTPWLLYVFTFDRPLTSPLPRRAWLIPPILFLFLTGAYPGNVIAGGLIVGLFVALQAVDALAARAHWRVVVTTTTFVGGLAALGCGMAAIHLGPTWLFREQYFRGAALDPSLRFGLWLEHLPGLFMSNAHLPGEISMTSTYVTLPIVILACLVPLTALRQRWVLVAVSLLAAVLAAGDRFPGGTALRASVQLLGLSRFPSSDYRAFVGVGVILMALSGLRAVVTKEDGALSNRWLLARLALAAMSVGLALRLAPALSRQDTVVAALSFLLTLGVVVGLWLNAKSVSLTVVTLAVAAVAIDAARVLPDIPGWKEPDMEAYYPRQGSPPYTRNRGRRLAPEYIVENLPATRPAREFPEDLTRWSGYINGHYYLNDLTPNVLRDAATVMGHERYRRYMSSSWTPLLLPLAVASDSALRIELPDSFLDQASHAASSMGIITQRRYGINDVTYDIMLNTPALLVENEMYFPGWTAHISAPAAVTSAGVTSSSSLTTNVVAGRGSDERFDAVVVNGVFRAWRLPAGTYQLTTRFHLPHLFALRAVTGSCAMLWLALWSIYLRTVGARTAEPAGVDETSLR